MSNPVPVVKAAAVPAKKARKAYKRLTDAQQTEAITLWKSGTVTLADLTKKFGHTGQTFQKLFVRVGAKKGEVKAALQAGRAAVVEAALVMDPAVHARRVYETKNETYRIIDMLRKLVAKQIVDCRTAGKPLGSIQNDLKAIREAASAIKVCREEAFAVLGLKIEDTGDEVLPELRITGLSEDDILDLQSAPMMDGMGDIEDLVPGEPLGDGQDDE